MLVVTIILDRTYANHEQTNRIRLGFAEKDAAESLSGAQSRSKGLRPSELSKGKDTTQRNKSFKEFLRKSY